MTFGENLARLRKKAGLSQEELAGKLNLTRQTVSKWETGQSEPDLASLTRLCQLLDAGPEELLGQRPRKEKTAPTDWPVVMGWAFLICAFLAGVVILRVIFYQVLVWDFLLLLEAMICVPPLLFGETAIRRVLGDPWRGAWAVCRTGLRCLSLTLFASAWYVREIDAFHSKIEEAAGYWMMASGILFLLMVAAEWFIWYRKKPRGHAGCNGKR